MNYAMEIQESLKEEEIGYGKNKNSKRSNV